MGRKLLTWLGRAAYVGLLGVVFVLAAYAAFSVFVRSGVTSIPKVQGYPEEAARAMLSDQGLEVVHDHEEDRYDPLIATGMVLDQRPRSGSLVKRGSAVQLVLSRGPHQVAVPDVVGEPAQAAQVTLAASGLAAGEVLTVWAEGDAAGQVVMQDPPAGNPAPPATAVRLFVAADGRASTFVMPDLIYRGYDQVRSVLQGQGFRFGSVKFEPYEGVAGGTVLRQFPLAGHPLRRQDPISLVVAAEPAI